MSADQDKTPESVPPEDDHEEDHEDDSEDDEDDDMADEMEDSSIGSSDDHGDEEEDHADEDPKKDSSPDVSFDGVLPLIPVDFVSIVEAIENFSSVFGSRYGNNFAPFFSGTLQEAMTEAFEAPGRSEMERRPLVVYLHHDNSDASATFAQNIMCSDQISRLLKCQFVSWPWDMSRKANREKLCEWLTESKVVGFDRYVKKVHRSRYPLMLVLAKDRETTLPVSIIKGDNTAPRTVEKLMIGLDLYTHIKNRAAVEKQHRLDSERIRQEQLVEYEKSLAADRAKQEELAKQREREREEQLEKERKQAEKLARQLQLASTLPSEPAISEENVIAIRVRCPNGEHKMRRFRMRETISWLVTYVESIGFDMDSHGIWTSDLPKKDVCALDLSKTFMELAWASREQITVYEK